jgi:microcystin-dependent protein
VSLPALHHGADIRSITERVNVLIRDYNNPPAPPAPTPVQRLVPAGTLLPFAGAAAPAGFLLCSGQAVSRTDYADLFAVIGTTYGAGNGTTTFNLPDLRGRVAAGKGDMGGSESGRLNTIIGSSLGAAGGQQTLQYALSASGSGSGSGTAFTNGLGTGHAGGATTSTSGGGGTGSRPDHFHFVQGNAAVSVNVSVSVSGATDVRSNVQPTIVLNYVIAT